jgi:hypothetical protein
MWISVWHCFHSTWENSFNISCSVGVLVTDSWCCCLSESVSILSSF